MVDDGLFGIGGQGPNFFDADPQARDVALGAGFRQKAPGSQRGTDPREVFEPFRSHGGIHMHDRQFGPVNQGQLEGMGKGHVTVMREICGMKNALDGPRRERCDHIDMNSRSGADIRCAVHAD